MLDLSTQLHGLKLPNPFIVGSGPPGTNANVIGKAFDEGWGAVVSKTVILDASKIVNVSPRYARFRSGDGRQIIGWQNIELISDRPFETWLDEFRRLKDRYPDRVLIASIMEQYNRDAWCEIVERVQETGVDGLELNLSCPHGLPEQHMGSAMGQDPEIVYQVCGWVSEAAKVPVWAKLTPNVTDITEPGSAALSGGCEGLSAINTILCVMGVNLETLRPEPTVAGYSEPGGYSSVAIRPISLRMNMELARMMRSDFPGRSLVSLGGIETGDDAVQFMLIGAHAVQVCTGVMKHGYGLVKPMLEQLEAFMSKHGFETIDAFRGHSLSYFTTHADLVRRHAEERGVSALHAISGNGSKVRADADWDADAFVQQSAELAGD